MDTLLRLVLMAAVGLAAAAAAAVTLALAPPAVAGLAAAALLVAALRPAPRPAAEFGTARWAEAADVPHLLEGQGLILGHVGGRTTKAAGVRALFDRRLPARWATQALLLSFRRSPPPRLVRLTDQLHTAVFAPSGAGKGVSVVLPLLLTTPDSCVVVDLKGELAQLTAARRARAFGQRVVQVDPFRLATADPAAFNVLAGIDPADPECLDDVRAVAEAVVTKSPGERDPHWTQKAEAFLAGAIAAVVHFCPAGKKSLQEVAEVMADPKLLDGAVAALCRSPAHGGLLARLGHEMAHSAGTERSGILSTAQRSLAFLSTVAVAESTGGAAGGFDPADLVRGRGCTVYLTLPVQYLRSHAGLLRLWVTALTRAVVRRGAGGGGRPVQVVLDECAAMGRLEAVEDMLTIGRGFGLKVTAIFQSMAQLKKVLPEGQDGVFLANTTQVFFAVNDQPTAEYVSARLGEATQTVWSGGTTEGGSRQSASSGGGGGGSQSWGSSRSWQLGGRKLLQPSEVAQLDPGLAVTFHQGVPPLLTRLVKYYEPGWGTGPAVGRARAWVDAACLLAAAAFLAVLAAAALFSPTTH